MGVLYGLTAGIFNGLLEFRRSLLTNSLSNRSLPEVGAENIFLPIILNIMFYIVVGIILSVIIERFLGKADPRWIVRRRHVLALALFVPSLIYCSVLMILITNRDFGGNTLSFAINLLLLIAAFAYAVALLYRSTGDVRGGALRIPPIIGYLVFALFIFRLVHGLDVFGTEGAGRKMIPPGESTGLARPNVLLITIDTLRWNYLGCYDTGGALTPNIDGIAESGARFDNSYATVPLTIPSHASIFTGRYPNAHGVRTNLQWSVLDPANTTLAEILRDSGYVTGAFIGAVLINRNSGLDKGFDHYGDIFDHMWYKLFKSGAFLVSQVLIRTGLMEKEEYQVRTASEVTDHALEWLEKVDHQRFFLWIHYYDPHTPYNPPREFLELYVGDSRKEEGSEIPVNENVDYYKAEISYTDHQIGRIFEALTDREIMDNTLIVITSDHGESLGEHGYFGHGFKLYEQSVRVPLIMRLPGVLESGQVLDPLNSSIDVAPTLLDILSIDATGEFDGSSFYPILQKGDEGERDLVYVETLAMYEENEMKYGVKSTNWKLIFTVPDSVLELFNLDVDPDELRNLAGTNEVMVDSLLSALNSYLESGKVLEPARDFDRESDLREELRALGYLQ
jgi:arylsulfatase A-like enzyme